MKVKCLTLLVLVSVSAFSQSRKIEFTEYDLDNGLHVILHQDASTPIVAVSALYHVGSKNEDSTRTGFAHFFEHLLFEGSDNIKRGEFDKYITNAGGINNANTTEDRTFYYEVLPSNQLALGLWLESERMMHAKIEEVGVETQREVVKEEKRSRYDNQPYGSILIELLSHAYKTSPYRWAPIGSMDDLNAATLDEFIGFYNNYYVPQNATLSIAGDIDITQTRKLVGDYFSGIPRGKEAIERPSMEEPPQKHEVRDTIFDNIQLPAVIEAYHIPGQGTPDSYALEMLSTLLSGGESSRMYKALVDEQKKAAFVQAFPFTLEDAGLYITYGFVNVGVDPTALEEGMNVEVEKVKNALVSEQEFQKIRNQVESDFIQRNGSVAGIAESLADYHVYYNDTNLINTELERYMKVTREDLMRVAKKYLTKDQRVVLYYLPKTEQMGVDN